MKGKRLVYTAIGLAIGNLIWAACGNITDAAAFERTYFQTFAVFASYLAVRRA